MKQVWISKMGPPSVLEVREAPDPTPGPGQVRIAVKAAGVNFADLMARVGLYPDAPPVPCVVGYEVSGLIDAVGQGVSPERVGRPALAMTRFGGYSSSVVVDQLQAVELPPGMDVITAASIPVNGLTAWMMLEVMGRVQPGDRVLVHSAGGGVGLLALDILKWRGATAIGTASPSKHAFLKERGYDELIDYRSQDFFEVLKDKPGLDLILDPIGGESWAKGLALLRAGGRLICFGMSANSDGDTRNPLKVLRTMAHVPWLKINPITLMNENKGVMGVNMGHLWNEAPRIAGWMSRLMELWSEGVLRPVIHATLPFEQAPEAHRMLHDRENTGKVLLTP